MQPSLEEAKKNATVSAITNLRYLQLLWIFLKVTVDTQTQKTMKGKWQNTLGFAILVAFNNPTCGWVRQVFLHVEPPLAE